MCAFSEGEPPAEPLYSCTAWASPVSVLVAGVGGATRKHAALPSAVQRGTVRSLDGPSRVRRLLGRFAPTPRRPNQQSPNTAQQFDEGSTGHPQLATSLSRLPRIGAMFPVRPSAVLRPPCSRHRRFDREWFDRLLRSVRPGQRNAAGERIPFAALDPEDDARQEVTRLAVHVACRQPSSVVVQRTAMR